MGMIMMNQACDNLTLELYNNLMLASLKLGWAAFGQRARGNEGKDKSGPGWILTRNPLTWSWTSYTAWLKRNNFCRP